MNAQTSLSFRNVSFDITDIHGQPWLRGLQVASALGYSDGAVAIAKFAETGYYDRTTKLRAVQSPRQRGFFMPDTFQVAFNGGMIAVNTIPSRGNSGSRLVTVVESRPPHSVGSIN